MRCGGLSGFAGSWMADLVCEGFVKGFDRCKFLW